MENNITFHINNRAYTITVDSEFKKDVIRYLNTEKNLDTKELLAAYLRVSRELHNLKQDLEVLSEKIPKL